MIDTVFLKALNVDEMMLQLSMGDCIIESIVNMHMVITITIAGVYLYVLISTNVSSASIILSSISFTAH